MDSLPVYLFLINKIISSKSLSSPYEIYQRICEKVIAYLSKENLFIEILSNISSLNEKIVQNGTNYYLVEQTNWIIDYHELIHLLSFWIFYLV